MSAGPTTSVIVPAFNAAPYLAETLESVRAQTDGDWELIVVDDGSTDQTPLVARQFAARDGRIRLIGQARQGVSAARNRGASESRAAEFVTFLDADDVWEPVALATLTEALRRRPTAVAVHGFARLIDAQGRPIRPGEQEAYARDRREVAGGRLRPVPLSAPTRFAALVFQNCIPAGGILLRRAAFEAVGGFDPAMSPAEDWDLWLRVSRVGDIAFQDCLIYGYRQHGANTSADPRRMRRAQRRVRRRVITDHQIDAPTRQAAILGARLADRELCAHLRRQFRGRLGHGQLFAAAKLVRHIAVVSAQAALDGARWAARYGWPRGIAEDR